MANLNRLKVVLAEQQKTGKWLAEQIGISPPYISIHPIRKRKFYTE